MAIGDLRTGLSIRIPHGTPAVRLNSLRYKDLIQDLVLNERDPDTLEVKYRDLLTPERFAELQAGLTEIRQRLIGKEGFLDLDITRVQGDFIQGFYSNVLWLQENSGHSFGEDLSERDKQALTAFLATL
jgi:hypothetical protein